MPFFPTVLTCIGWGSHNFAVMLVGCHALALLAKSKSPYPRVVWEAAKEHGVLPALIELLDKEANEASGSSAVSEAAKAALANVTKNNKELITMVEKGRAKGRW